MTGARLPFDPIGEAARLWSEHGWETAADGMAAVTSLMRAQAIVQSWVDDVLRPLQLSFARYELLMLLSFTRQGRLPMAKAGARLQVHPTSVTNAASRLEAAGLVERCQDPNDGRGVLVTITDAGRETAALASKLLNEQVFSRPELSSPGMRDLFGTLKDLRRTAGDFDE
ncbi:MarR family winged helix-turn-helix transcriptional regulator [Actinoplanes derwentensis]|uniref:DNA-binding transcriptional regulator, MarR family n=1 Tax=Actinoplanes derwentensis TaxID=113562 RepID=A0A1H1VML0_9ACTN|nr:MarR family transcriptional regulator [Actinoplanes derwentensis]GID83652.1 putative transcriptional regulator, MarR family protein [Actinoplanes derwentensis]SDS85963.1 DNA-binding transcriptional regulator, MarR family [Actinoplanes derwentensis]